MSENTNKSIYEKLQQARVLVQQSGIKKGGKNTFARYEYFELPDFLPQSNEAFRSVRATPVFNINEEVAELVLYDWDSDKTIKFETPVADATTLNKQGQPSNLAIQSLGSQHTYLKRYLYMHLLELAEHDGLEPNTGNPDYKPNDVRKQKEPSNKPKKLVELATTEQIEYAKEVMPPEMLMKMLEKYEVSDIKEMEKDILHKILIIRENQLEKEKSASKGLRSDLKDIETKHHGMSLDEL